MALTPLHAHPWFRPRLDVRSTADSNLSPPAEVAGHPPLDPTSRDALLAWGGRDGFAPTRGVATAQARGERRYSARGTGYFPENSRMEGGFFDRKGKPLHTLQDFLAGKAPFVSVAMDKTAFPYGTKLRIPELEQKYGRPIEFRVVDTGGAFRGRGTSRIDICTANRRASLDPTINGRLTLIPQ